MDYTKLYPTLDLHGEYSFSAKYLTEEFINDNIQLKNKKICIIHGIGEGILKNTVHDILKNDSRVKSFKPMKLVELIDNIIKEKGEISFYRENEWSDVYWNIVFYFQLFDLPTCVLYVQNNMDKFEKLKNILKENKKF